MNEDRIPFLFCLLAVFNGVVFWYNASIFGAFLQGLLLIYFLIRQKRSFAILLAIFFIIAYGSSWQTEWAIARDPLSFLPNQNISFSAQIKQEYPLAKQGQVLIVNKLKISTVSGNSYYCKGKAEIRVFQQAGFKVGQYIKGSGFLDQFFKATNPHQFCLQFFKRQSNILRPIYVNANDELSVIKDSLNPIYRFRNYCTKRYIDNIPSPYSDLVRAMVLGDRNYLADNIAATFQQAGLNHILAISGLHIGIIVILFWKVLGLIIKNNLWRIIIFNLLLIGYVFLANMGPSLMRAALLAMILSGSYYLKRKNTPLNSLCFCGVIIVLWQPLSFWRVGFQFSFIITAFIMMGQNVLAKINHGLAKMIAVSILASLAALPLAAYYFYQVTPLSFIANLGAIPLTAIIIFSSLVGVVPFLGVTILKHITYPAAYLLTKTGEFFSQLPLSSLNCTIFAGGEVAIFYLSLLLGLKLLSLAPIPYLKIYQRRQFLLAYLLIFVIYLVLMGNIFNFEKPLLITFLDVGQGDSIHLETPQKINILIDGGGHRGEGGENIGNYLLLPYLKGQNIKKLDLIIISHFHEDHYRGLLPVLREFPVDLVLGPPLFDIAAEQELFAVLAAKDISYQELRRGDKIVLAPNLTINCLHPGERLIYDSPLNNNSVVLLVTYYQNKFLFTGDIEYEAEIDLIAAGLLEGVNVLKVAHHGSATSSSNEFLRQVKPQFAVICVGENNYNHPASEVLDRLVAHGTTVFQTQSAGAVFFAVYKDRLVAKRFLQDRNSILQPTAAYF